MADVDPKVAQRVFKDYARGLHIPDIAERHGIATTMVSKVVKFESAVQARVREALAKAEAKPAAKPRGRK